MRRLLCRQISPDPIILCPLIIDEWEVGAHCAGAEEAPSPRPGRSRGRLPADLRLFTAFAALRRCSDCAGGKGSGKVTVSDCRLKFLPAFQSCPALLQPQSLSPRPQWFSRWWFSRWWFSRWWFSRFKAVCFLPPFCRSWPSRQSSGWQHGETISCGGMRRSGSGPNDWHRNCQRPARRRGATPRDVSNRHA